MVIRIDKTIPKQQQVATPESQERPVKESLFTVNGEPVYTHEQTAQQSPKETPSSVSTETSVVPEETAIDPDKLTVIEQYAQKIGFKGTIDELLRDLKLKQMSGDLSEEESAIINFIETDDKTETASATESNVNSNEITSQKETEYQQIISSKDETNYKKTFNVLDKYLFENDEQYKSLTSDKDKKAYIDRKIHDLLKFFKPDAKVHKNGTLDLSVEERAEGFQKIMTLCIAADVKGADINEITSNGLNNTHSFINEYVQSKTNKIADMIGLDDKTKSSDEILRNAMGLALAKDKKYQSLSGEAKEAYLKEKSVDYISKILGIKIPVEALDKPENAILKDGAVALLREIHNQGFNIDDFAKFSSKAQAEILKQTLKNNPQMLEKLSPEQKRSFSEYKARLSIITELEIDNPTENDIYKALLNKQKNTQLSESEKDLLNYYSNISQRSDCQSMLNAKAGLTSFIGLACLTGKQPEEIRDMSLQSVDWAKANTRDGDVNLDRHIRLLGTDGTIEDIKATEQHYRVWAKKQCWSDEKIDAEWVKICKKYNISRVSGSVAAHHAVRGEAVDSREAFNYGMKTAVSDEDKQNLNNQVTHSIKYFKAKEQVFDFNDGLHDSFADSAGKGMQKYQSRETNLYVVSRLSQSQNTTSNYKSTLTSSLVKYSDATDQLYYGQEFSKIKDAAVTEGLAAAEQYVDASVRSQYSQHVDNAIKNNGYSSDEINNINTARETGQTSYERNSVSSDSSKTSTADSKSSTNSTSNKSANSTTVSSASSQTATANAKAKTTVAPATTTATRSSSGTTASSSSKVKVSPANSNAVNEMKAQIAQVNYEHSVALRDKALADLERVIDKIQSDQQVRAEKQAKIAEKEAKTDEEIAQAIKEAEAKSAEEQKQVQEQITKETIAEIEQKEKLEKKYHISAETIEVLRNAQKQGDLSTIYTKLGEISADAQKHFVQYLSRKDTSTIIGFIRNQSTNKALIKELCRLNPGLIKSLDAQMLLDCGIEKADIIKYSDSHQLSVLMYDLAKTGNTRVLNQFYDALGDDAQQVSSMPSKPVPGSDEWMMANMPVKVSMRHDIDKHVPRKFWG